MESKIERLRDTFKTMSYGENIEDTSLANQWLQSVEIVDRSADIERILDDAKSHTNKGTKGLLLKLGKELVQNVNIISQIEILSRGVLSKDTRKAVQLLAEFFYYYGNLYQGNSKGVAAAIYEDDHPLWLLGLFLAPALASGHTVVLQTGTKLAAAVMFIQELATKVGIPKDAFVLIPSNEGQIQAYLNAPEVDVLALFVDVFHERYQEATNPHHKKLLVFSAYKTPALIFEDADLDSAANSAIENAWGYQGMLPWAVGTVLVQENIFKKFTDKLKQKIVQTRIGNGSDKLADVSYPSNPAVFQNLTTTLDKAKSMGIEVFQKDTSCSNFVLPLIIGAKVATDNVLTRPANDYALTVLPFRSVDEAINLANNTRQGLGASIWSENIGLIQEVSTKLKAGNIWINGHGLIAPNIPITPIKDSGTGYFGSIQGLQEYNPVTAKETESLLESSDFATVEAVNAAIIAGKKASAAWNGRSVLYKMLVFGQLRELLDKNELMAKNEVEQYKELIDAIVYKVSKSETAQLKGYSAISHKNPRGVLAIEMENCSQTHCVRLLLAALFAGNAVLLLHKLFPRAHLDFYAGLSKLLPAGLLSLIPFSLDATNTAFKHRELNGYFSGGNSILGQLPIRESKNAAIIRDDIPWKQVFNHVTTCKNVWINVGGSSQCSL